MNKLTVKNMTPETSWVCTECESYPWNLKCSRRLTILTMNGMHVPGMNIGYNFLFFLLSSAVILHI